MDKDPAIYVRHILEAIANIETDIAGYDFQKFRADRRTRQIVERNLEILSEASRRLPNEPATRIGKCKSPGAQSPVSAMSCGTTITNPIQPSSGTRARRT
jgi:ribonuclease HepT-like protein